MLRQVGAGVQRLGCAFRGLKISGGGCLLLYADHTFNNFIF